MDRFADSTGELGILRAKPLLFCFHPEGTQTRGLYLIFRPNRAMFACFVEQKKEKVSRIFYRSACVFTG